jgi:Uncharacterized protein conserved in bacteria (DUF2252)
MRKARGRDRLQALSKLIRVVDGRRMIEDDPPLPVRVVDDESRERIYEILQMYKRSLQDDRSHLLDEYLFVDVTRKVVGIGSVGTRDFVVLLEGVTKTILCFSRSRKQKLRCWNPTSQRAPTRIGGSASLPANSLCRPRGTSSSAGFVAEPVATSTCDNCET